MQEKNDFYNILNRYLSSTQSIYQCIIKDYVVDKEKSIGKCTAIIPNAYTGQKEFKNTTCYVGSALDITFDAYMQGILIRLQNRDTSAQNISNQKEVQKYDYFNNSTDSFIAIIIPHSETISNILTAEIRAKTHFKAIAPKCYVGSQEVNVLNEFTEYLKLLKDFFDKLMQNAPNIASIPGAGAGAVQMASQEIGMKTDELYNKLTEITKIEAGEAGGGGGGGSQNKPNEDKPNGNEDNGNGDTDGENGDGEDNENGGSQEGDDGLTEEENKEISEDAKEVVKDEVEKSVNEMIDEGVKDIVTSAVYTTINTTITELIRQTIKETLNGAVDSSLIDTTADTILGLELISSVKGNITTKINAPVGKVVDSVLNMPTIIGIKSNIAGAISKMVNPIVEKISNMSAIKKIANNKNLSSVLKEEALKKAIDTAIKGGVLVSVRESINSMINSGLKDTIQSIVKSMVSNGALGSVNSMIKSMLGEKENKDKINSAIQSQIKK